MERMIKAAKELIRKRKIKLITRERQIMYQVGEHYVRIFKKPGRTLLTCSCEHGTRFCNSPTICKHKLAVIKKITDKKRPNYKKLATWMHEQYEKIAKKVGWKTQKDCSVIFEDLPEKNKEVMFELAKRIIKRFNL